MKLLLRLGSCLGAIMLVAACAQRPSPEPEPEVTQPDPLPTAVAGAKSEAELLRHPIRFYRDIHYAANDNAQQSLDVYVPDNPSYVPMPVVIYLPGGLWQDVDKDEAPGRLLSLVTSGDYAVVSVNYRTTDEAQWPAQLHDVKAAIRWVRARADQYGFDPQRIALWGRESGGHLALMAAVTNSAQDMAGTLGPYAHIRSDVAAVVNYAGVSDVNALLGQDSDIDRSSSTAPEAALIGGLLTQNSDIASAASPVHYIRQTTPPVFTAHSSDDSVTPFAQSRRLHQILEDAEIESYLVNLVQAGSPTAEPVEADSAWGRADARAVSFLNRVLLGSDTRVSTSSIE